MNRIDLGVWGFAAAALLTTPAWAGSVDAPPLAFTGSIGDLVETTFVSGLQQFTIGTIPLGNGDLPLELNQGDSLTATVTLNGAFTIPASPNQFFILDFGSGGDPPSFDVNGDSVVQGSLSFFLGGSFLFNSSSGCSNCVNLTAGFFPGTAYSFDRIDATLNVTNLTDPFTISPTSVVLRYQLSQPVPEPETWALWAAGLGLMSLWTRRRRGAAVKASAH